MRVNSKSLKFQKPCRQFGFSLVEMMVGLVIGLIATLVIMQTFSAFEGNKRSTTGIADAQTSGSIGLYMIQRELQFAGYGIPVASGTLPTISGIIGDPGVAFDDYTGMTQAQMDAADDAKKAEYDAQLLIDAQKVAAGKNFSALKCDTVLMSLDTDGDPTTPDVNNVDIITPAKILDGGAGSDTITIQYGTTTRGALPTEVKSGGPPYANGNVGVNNNMGCRGVSATHPNGDIVLAVGDSNAGDTVCVGSKVASNEVVSGAGEIWLDAVGNSNQIKVADSTGMYDAAKPKRLACLGQIRQMVFRVNNNQLEKNGFPVVSEIVALQAQYGISPTANSEIVNQWVSAGAAPWNASPLAIANRNRIKAIRVALVARNNLLEREVVSQACNDTAVGPAKVCIWGNQNVALPDANWANYRYRAYEIVIPLRNVLAASPQL